MPRKRFSAIVFVLVAIAGGVVVQMSRHRLQADDSVRGTSALGAACADAPAHVESPRAASDTSSVNLRLDYAGALALINALERDSLSDADVDSLLRIRGVCAVVDNVPRFFPGFGASEFRQEIRSFVRSKKGGKYDGYFRLKGVWDDRSKIRELIAAIQANERTMMEETRSQLERYRPDTGALAVSAYFVAGGVSTGFAFESDPTSFFANLVRAGGDLNGIVSNMAHEAYHVMQFRAQEQAGINPLSLVSDTTPPVVRLFATTLTEGTANYVVDPTRSTATGPNVESSRERYRRHAQPKQIASDFARFDDVLKALRDGSMTWEKAYREGFTSDNDASFYFVGYEMTKALDRHCGRECIVQLFREPPVEFFRRYIALYQKHPELTARFSAGTEAFIAAYGTKPGS